MIMISEVHCQDKSDINAWSCTVIIVACVFVYSCLFIFHEAMIKL